ncbi:hypothetical protein D3C73_1419760 [compost metagenome]
MPGNAVRIHLVPYRLEAADDNGRFFPVPEPQGGIAPPCSHFLREDLVQRNIDLCGQNRGRDDLPLVVCPPGGLGKCAPDCDSHRLSGEPEHDCTFRQAGSNGCGDVGRC